MGGQTSKREMACSNLITCVQNRSPHNTIHIFSSIRTDSCQDKIANCNSYKQQGYCESMPDTMKNYCPKTCFACGELAIKVSFFSFLEGTFLQHSCLVMKRNYSNGFIYMIQTAAGFHSYHVTGESLLSQSVPE